MEEAVPKHRSRRLITLSVVLLLAVIAAGSGWFINSGRHRGITNNNEIPAYIAHQITGFTPYFLNQTSAVKFTLQKSTTTYQDNVLIFSMNGASGKTLAFTEEALPPGFDTSTLSGDRQFNTSYGQGFIFDGLNRTTGTLLTHDKTWVLINAPSPIGADLMEQVIDNLVPQ